MTIYVTLLGRSVWALLNTYYAAADEGCEPDVIHVFAEESYRNSSEEVEEGLKIISEGYGFSPEIKIHVVDDVDFVKAGKKIRKTLRQLMEGGNEVSIDITPGRKALVTAALLSAFDLSAEKKLNVDNVLYLAVSETKPKPYYEIPFQIQDLRNLIEDIEEAKTKEG